MRTLGIIGGGAWGTALAAVARQSGLNVTLWAREAEVVEAIARAGENRAFLPGVPLDPEIRATTELASACEADLVLLTVPAAPLLR